MNISFISLEKETTAKVNCYCFFVVFLITCIFITFVLVDSLPIKALCIVFSQVLANVLV